jgi:hypothetical protein
MENIMEDVEIKIEKKIKKIKKTKIKKCDEEVINEAKTKNCNADTISETIKNIKINEKNMVSNEDLQYGDIEAHKNNAEKIIDNINDIDNKLNDQEVKLNEHVQVKTIISEIEFNDKIKFIEDHQDIDLIDVEKSVSVYNTLSQYIDECTLYVESTNMVVHHC